MTSHYIGPFTAEDAVGREHQVEFILEDADGAPDKVSLTLRDYEGDSDELSVALLGEDTARSLWIALRDTLAEKGWLREEETTAG